MNVYFPCLERIVFASLPFKNLEVSIKYSKQSFAYALLLQPIETFLLITFVPTSQH
jgi:hypothetical protein